MSAEELDWLVNFDCSEQERERMKLSKVLLAGVALGLVAGTASAQGRGGAASAANTDIYHVEFVKAAPGQALAAATELQKQDPKAPMQGHFVVLRHQDGDDWDFCVIEHVGTKATVEIGAPPPASPTPTTAWHNDTFVVGPSWAEFQRAMGAAAGGVYIVSTHRAVPGHRDQLVATLNQADPASKVKYGHLLFTHLEGGAWQYLSVDHYNSWSELATDRSSAVSGQGWADVRAHSASHSDTIADRLK